jgi:hypothetical protein
MEMLNRVKAKSIESKRLLTGEEFDEIANAVIGTVSAA